MIMTSDWTLPVTAKLTVFFLLLMMTTIMMFQQPSEAVAVRDGSRPVVVVPPRAYFLCWKGVCDPRLWDDMVKRNHPYYSFGLGKRSVQTYDDVINPVDVDDHREPSESNLYDQNKRSRYNFGVGKKADNYQRFRFGLGKRATENGRRRFSFGLGKRAADDDEDNDNDEVSPDEEGYDVNKRKSAYNFGLGKRNKMYSFGLGKREKMYSFGLGKRGGATSAADRLEKREIRERQTFEEYNDNDDNDDSPYMLDLGSNDPNRKPKEEHDPSQESGSEVDKKARFSFGLGKRSEDGVHPAQSVFGTTVLPDSAGQQSKPF